MKVRLPICTIVHFLVDLTCIYRMTSQVMPLCGNYGQWIRMAVFYNFLAFALPALLGILADLGDADESLAALGCLLTALPVFLSRSTGCMVLLQGIGNGLFHVGAGRKLLLEARGRCTPAGIFISSGALGVFLGTAWKHMYRKNISWLLAGLLFASALLLLWMHFESRKRKEQGQDVSGGQGVPFLTTSRNRGFLSLSVFWILLVVVLRSYYGTAVSYEWKNTLFRSFIFVLCIVAGKASGGFLADRIGVRAAVWWSLGGAALTVLFSEHSILFGCVSILLFNMTMPITLHLITERWRGYPGLAFGMLMLALFVGTIPELLGKATGLSVRGLCGVALLSLAGLVAASGDKRQVVS